MDFDAKTPFELLQTLQAVLAALDSRQDVDLRAEPEAQRAGRITKFLALLTFRLPGSEDARAFGQGLARGEKGAVYPVLAWLLQKFPERRKRAYLARYLARVDVPPEELPTYLADASFASLWQRHEELKEEFIGVHKASERLAREAEATPTSLRQDITQLEEERRSLVAKIAANKRDTRGEPGFEEMLDATRAFRLAQEEDQKLAGRREEQRALLQAAEARYEEAAARRDELQASWGAHSSAEAILEQLERVAAQAAQGAQQDLWRTLRQRRARVEELEDELRKPHRSAGDVAAKQESVARCDGEAQALRAQLDKAIEDNGDSRVGMFLAHARAASRELADRRDTLERLQRQRRDLQARVLAKERSAAELAAARGQRFVTREQQRSAVASVKEKKATFQRMRTALGELERELVALQRTEQLLRAQASRLDIDLTLLEAQQGVSGFRDTRDRLSRASERTAQTDLEKGRLIEEITQHVNDMQRETRARRDQLKPLMDALRAERERSREAFAEYSARKDAHDRVAVGLQLRVGELERACADLEQECLREESRYHCANCAKAVSDAMLLKVQREERCAKGEDRLMRDFSTFRELYGDKLTRQMDMTRQLRKLQAQIREKEGPHAKQRDLFSHVRSLLQAKTSCGAARGPGRGQPGRARDAGSARTP